MAMGEDLKIPTKTLDDLISAEGAFQHINDTYGLNIFPVFTRDPRGISRGAKFEEIDLKLYPSRTMLAFRIGPDPDQTRMMCWLKAHWVIYEYLRKEKNSNIEWKNVPKDWTPQTLKSIDIIVKPIRSEYMYRISFYLKTGTVQAVGNLFKNYAKDHFPCIKYLFQKIHGDIDELHILEPSPSVKTELSTLQSEVKDLSAMLKNVRRELYETNAVFEDTKDDNKEMKKQMRGLEERLKRLEIDSKQNNVVIVGLDIRDVKGEAQIEGRVKEMFLNKLGLLQDIEIEQVRPLKEDYLVVKLRHFSDKNVLIRAAGVHTDSGIYITSDN